MVLVFIDGAFLSCVSCLSELLSGLLVFHVFALQLCLLLLFY
jgi:hypothetical protein